MTRGLAPRRVARRVLGASLREGAFASRLLPREVATLSDRDAALARELALGSLRMLRRVDRAIASVSKRPLDGIDPPVLDALRIGAYQVLFLSRVPPWAAVSVAVAEARDVGGEGAAKLANAILRRVAQGGEPALPADLSASARLALEASLPEWWVERLVARHGLERARAVAHALAMGAEIDLAWNPARTSEASVLKHLAEKGIGAKPVPGLPLALSLPGALRPPDSLLRAGLALVIDVGAQVVASLLPLEKGERVLDAAAAPGGKAALLLSRGARVVAQERSLERIGRLRRNLEAWGGGSRIVVGDLEQRVFRECAFDAVLLDAPCSGSGTMRQHPEIRWRLAPAELHRHADVQRELLARALKLVRPGGRVLYSTCSLEPEENEDVVDAIVAAEPSLAVLPPRAFGLPFVERVDSSGGVAGLRSFPSEVSDGHSAFLLEKR